MNIQWFPGHMLETKKLLETSISKVDIVLEILDARIPDASANPLVEKLCGDRFKARLLNKKDLADPAVTGGWLTYFQKKKIFAAAVSAFDPSEVWKAVEYCVNQIERNRAKKVKIMVLGIPNTGKSTLLNTLAGKKIAKTGNVPAVTRHNQRTSLKNNIDIYDTPGILWPVIEPEEKAMKLAALGAISDSAVDYEKIGFFCARFLLRRYPNLLLLRYDFLKTVPKNELELIEAVGARRGCLKKGGIINMQKACELLIRELRAAKIGRISFETSEDTEYDN